MPGPYLFHRAGTINCVYLHGPLGPRTITGCAKVAPSYSVASKALSPTADGRHTDIQTDTAWTDKRRQTQTRAFMSQGTFPAWVAHRFDPNFDVPLCINVSTHIHIVGTKVRHTHFLESAARVPLSSKRVRKGFRRACSSEADSNSGLPVPS